MYKSDVCSSRTWLVPPGSPLFQHPYCTGPPQKGFLGGFWMRAWHQQPPTPCPRPGESQSSWACVKTIAAAHPLGEASPWQGRLASSNAALQSWLLICHTGAPIWVTTASQAQGRWLLQAEVWPWALAMQLLPWGLPSCLSRRERARQRSPASVWFLVLSLQIVLIFFLPSATPKSSQRPPEVLGGGHSAESAPHLLGEALKEEGKLAEPSCICGPWTQQFYA